mmetsp:Transcript_49161/g.44019  ORF Transcript_49161/g.44019 Transcript_49161/m.44019 type:complete len:85 (-) Transcript_49161:30-284(-)
MAYHNNDEDDIENNKNGIKSEQQICSDKSSETKQNSSNQNSSSKHISHPTATYTTNDISVDHGRIHIRGQNTQTLETTNVNLEI